MPLGLFHITIPIDATEAVEAADTMARAYAVKDRLPAHLREAVERFASPATEVSAGEAAPALTGVHENGFAVIGCNPALRAVLGLIRAEGVA